MIKKEDLAKIAEITKIPVADLEKAIAEKDEVALTLPDGLVTYTPAELTQLKANEYKNGKAAGVEMAVKETREELGLDFQGKTIKGLLEAHEKKVLADAKIEPEKKVTELTEQIATLKKTVGTLEAAISEKDKAVKTTKIEAEASVLFPELENFSRKELLTLTRSAGIDFDVNDEGKLVVMKDGKVVQTKTGDPEDPRAVVNEFLTSKKLVADQQKPAGRGGSGGGGPVKPTSYKEAKEVFEAQGKSVQGQEFNEYVTQLKKDNPDFVMTNS